MPRVPPPAPPDAPDRLPCGVTFYLTHAQRARVLARLRPLGPDRARALLIALGIECDTRTATVRERPGGSTTRDRSG